MQVYFYYLSYNDNEPFYIGYTNNLRLRLTAHRVGHNSSRKMRELVSNNKGKKFIINKLFAFSGTKEDILITEKQLIKSYIDKRYTLVNVGVKNKQPYIYKKKKNLHKNKDQN